MPTIITHSVVAVSSAYGFNSGKESLKFWVLSILCSALPDADVIGYRWLYIPSYHFFRLIECRKLIDFAGLRQIFHGT
jgi:hypothetical protein